jgi:CDP-6-deoxy-D-xylo-4-hexulose-3-dehydrase
MASRADELRREILDLVRRYHDEAFRESPFEPGRTTVPYAGRVFDGEELVSLVDSSLDFWLTSGRFAARFEKELAAFFGLQSASFVNSGSSANLLAVSCLTSPKLGKRRMVPGDEVVTVAAAFPTTVNPILQNGLVPVFVDVAAPTWNVDVDRLEDALSPRTRGVVLAHTLGNPFDLDAVGEFVRRHGLWLVEDCCDAVGSTFRGKSVGTVGALATASFYPAHHLTTGEGGAVLTDDPVLRVIVESFRDWGRDCWCDPGRDGTCGKRFDWQLGDLPLGFDHKYTYSHVGYNLKATDLQAAIGVAQLAKLPGFIQARKRNFARLHAALEGLEDLFILPEATPGSDPAWFGFPIGIREEAPFDRTELLRFLDARKIAVRLLFGGNLVRQPAYRDARFRVAGPLDGTDFVMNRLFWLGVYPGLDDARVDWMAESLRTFVGRK